MATTPFLMRATRSIREEPVITRAASARGR
jgi:hypothetical protein